VTDSDLVRALSPVIVILERLGVRHYLAGSLASSVHGVPRASIDADVVADLRAEHAAPICAALESEYYVPVARVSQAIADRSSFNVIHLETMIKVDVFVAKPRPFDRRALERADLTVFDARAGLRVRTATPEDTVLAKLEWFRRGGEVSERQWTDVLGVLRTSRERLDAEYLRAAAAELGVIDLLQLAQAELEPTGDAP
jgi:hypothetical protein